LRTWLPSATIPEIFPRRACPHADGGWNPEMFYEKAVCLPPSTRRQALRGHDRKNSLNPEFNHNLKKIAIDKSQY